MKLSAEGTVSTEEHCGLAEEMNCLQGEQPVHKEEQCGLAEKMKLFAGGAASPYRRTQWAN
jgi:hypothetical protein